MNFEVKNTGENANGISELFAAIGKCQYEFPALPKNATVVVTKAGHKAKYVSLDQIIEGMKPQLSQYGVSFVQMLHSVDKDSAITLMVAGHGASVSTTFSFRRDTNPQDAGKQITYYKRYQLTSFFGIVGDEDADSDSVEENKRKYENKIAEENAEKAASVSEGKAPSRATVAMGSVPTTDAKPSESVESGESVSLGLGDVIDDRLESGASSGEDMAEAEAVQDEGNGKLYAYNRDGNATALKEKLNELKKTLGWTFEQFKKYSRDHNLFESGVDSVSKMGYSARADLVDHLMNNHEKLKQ